MQTATTFKEPFLTAVQNAVENAVSIAWEGCHKIYIQLDQESHDEMVEMDYDPVLVTEDKNAAVTQLWEWFDNSCGLRFINAIKGEGDGTEFIDVIPQFEYESDEDTD